MKPKITIITLGVKDLAVSLKFYRDGLGWLAKVQDDIAFFPMNGIILALYPRESLAEDATVDAAGSGFRGVTLAYNTESEAEVDAILAMVKTIGANVVKEAQKVFWGGYSGYFSDPDGHLWEVAYSPFSKLDEKGNVMMEV
jgi:catechol 2,3-dioxygenase-like lactoylglutathione lyase family enzyme